MVPAPGFRVDGLAHRPEQAQRRPVGPGHEIIALAHQRADSGRRGVEDVDAVLLYHLPEAADIGEIGHALEHQRGRPVHQRAVDDVGVPGDPAYVGGAPEHLARAIIKNKVMRCGRVDPVTAGGVEHALGFAGRAGGVEDEKRIFGVHRLGRAGIGLAVDQLVVPGIPRVPVHRPAGTPHHQRGDIAPGNLDGAVGVGLERDRLAPAQAFIGGDQKITLAPDNALAQRLGREPAEDDRVHRPDPRAGKHGIGRLGDHGHIEGHPVTLVHAHLAQAVGQPVHVPGQRAVGDFSGFVRVIALEDDGNIIGALGQVPVDGVDAQVQRTVFEPADLHVGAAARAVVHVPDLGEGRHPVQALGLLGPEGLVVIQRSAVERGVLISGCVGLGHGGRIALRDGVKGLGLHATRLSGCGS